MTGAGCDGLDRRGFLRAAAAGIALGGGAQAAESPPLPPSPPPPPGRRARIATVCQGGRVRRTIEENLEYIMRLLDRALERKPDLVSLPENFATAGLGGLSARERVEALDGATLTAASKRAKAARCYVVCPMLTARGERVYNSAVVIDRAGAVVGAYDKACPVTTSPDYTSLEGGVTPGSPDLPVFDLDFGRIGIQICYDIGFPENWELLRRKGARLVLWPSAYDGGFPLWAYAYIHHYYVMTSVRSGQSRIVDPCGAVLVETEAETPMIVRDVNLDFIVSHLDFNQSIPDKIKAKYGERVDVRRSNPGCSHFVVEPVDPAVTVAQLQEEFGFESTLQYHDRHRAVYPAAREGRPLPAQQARHGVRPQWGKF